MIDVKALPERLLVGLSGGADSVALLLLLQEGGAQVSAVHVNHGLRGAASDGDEAFVRTLCEKRRVPLYVYRADPPENPGEDWARNVRYGFFRQAMAASGADALVLAHHQDDQAETLLLHLVRGAGLNGLCGMAADGFMDGIRILRPLLSHSRAELREYLTQCGQGWREDASNAETRYLRNALRHELLPVMERLAPGAAQRMASTCRILAEDEAVLCTQTERFLDSHTGMALPLAELQTELPGLQKRILRAWWTRNVQPGEERSLSAMQSDALYALMDANTGARCNLPGGWHGYRGWTHIHLVPPEETAELAECLAAQSDVLLISSYAGEACDGWRQQAIPAGWLTDCVVRSRRRGDYIQPFGSSGRQSLQDYLTNRHIDAPFRDRVPLLCRGSEVLLAGGVGAGGIPRTESISNPVLIRWKEGFPWANRGR